MKLNKILVALTGCVYSVYAASSFIKEGKRAELFEITDNEVPVFKINIPKEDYESLRLKAKNGGLAQSFVIEFKDVVFQTKTIIMNELSNLKGANFKVLFPNEDLSKTFPELKINDKGYPEFDIEEVYNGYDWNTTRFDNDNISIGNYFFDFAQTNTNFDLIKIAYRMYDIKTEKLEGVDPETEKVLNEFKMMFSGSYGSDFKTKNASMTVDIKGEQKKFDKITFSLGGVSTRLFQRPGFNIKIGDGKDLYGRTQLKLRSENTEPTVLRTKLVTDIRNNLGLSTISANYATVYVNDDYLGFFVLRDAYKPSWIESEFGDKDTKSLYKCENLSHLTKDYSSVTCNNENEKIEDKTELIEFLTALDKAQSASDIEDIFEVDQFLTDMALEYLLGAWDHILYTGQNYYIYKQPNGKWKYLPYDHDYDFGMHMDRVGFTYIFPDMPERSKKVLSRDYTSLSYSDWIKHHHITDILIYKDPSRFEKILKDVVAKVFNPTTLYPYIDELKKYIKPYIQKELIDDKDKIVIYNPDGLRSFTYEEWDANSEFTNIRTQLYYAYGLKYWILGKYRYMCKTYQDIKCDSKYLDESYQYLINKKLEFTGYTEAELSLPNSNINSSKSNPDSPASTTVVEKPTTVVEKPTTVVEKPTTVVEKPTTVVEKPTTVVEKPTSISDSEKPTSVIEKPTSVSEKPTVNVDINKQISGLDLEKSNSDDDSEFDDSEFDNAEEDDVEVDVAFDDVEIDDTEVGNVFNKLFNSIEEDLKHIKEKRYIKHQY